MNAAVTMKMLALYWSLLRYRVAVMIVLFMLLGAVWHGGLASIDAPVLLSVLAVALGLAAGPGAAGIMLLSVAIGALYSLPPARLSYRTFLAPLTLAVAYVGIPYWAGVVAVGESLRTSDVPLLAALYLLFAGRIMLKDFRDREGDTAFGKPTFLLKYGKKATCLASLCALCAGDALLAASLVDRWWLAALLQLYIVSIAIMLYRLYRSSSRKDEQLSIGVGAKMGNGLLVTLLGALILSNQGADWITRFIFALALTAIYTLNFIEFLRHPERAIIGYKG